MDTNSKQITDDSNHDASLATVEHLKDVAADGELTMRFVMDLWETMTHCAEPDLYHETTKKLQDALHHEATRKKQTQSAVTAETSISQPQSAKQGDWEGLGIYQIQFTDDGSPIPDPEWPTTSRLVHGTTNDGIAFFELFKSEADSIVIDTTDPARQKLVLPQLKDDKYLVYRLGKKYRSGPAMYDADGNIAYESFNPGLTFDYAEHMFMGNQVNLTFPTYSEVAKGVKFRLGTNGLNLTYGEINALGGDFFGTFEPIMRGKDFAEQCELFRKAYTTLADAPGGFTAANKIQDIMKDEVTEIGKATDDGHKTADTLELYRKLKASTKALSDEDKKLNEATGGIGMPSYLALAQLNLDHFGWGAITSYNAGHYCAIEAARQGDLVKAYTMNAFADHYLGDCFSSGHFRTPRARLHGGDDGVQAAIDVIVAIAGSSTTLEMAGQIALEILNPWSSLIATVKQLAPDLCAKNMHDEDNILGLWLNNTRGDNWQVYGDAKLFTDENKLNAKFMLQALQVSADEVWKAHEQYKDKAIPLPDAGDANLYQAWAIAPSAETPRNHQPLFDVNGNRREPWIDPNARGRTEPNWTGLSYVKWAVDFVRSDYFSKLK
ncbi:hypothetical protein Slin14017_G097490 [Septoria linicola]|nr:hypothetical protein Slin14017_G097490 [Septoria linicola]